DNLDVELDLARSGRGTAVRRDVEQRRCREDHRVRVGSDGMPGAPRDPARGRDRGVPLVLDDGSLVHAGRKQGEVRVAVEVEPEARDRELRGTLNAAGAEVDLDPDDVPDVAHVVDVDEPVARVVRQSGRCKPHRKDEHDEKPPQEMPHRETLLSRKDAGSPCETWRTALVESDRSGRWRGKPRPSGAELIRERIDRWNSVLGSGSFCQRK